MKNEITINIILDGFRYDYISHTTFLKKLSESDMGYLSNTQEPFGFTSTAPAFLSGVFPKKAGTCFGTIYSSKKSPFRMLKIFRIGQFVKYMRKYKIGDFFIKRLFRIINMLIGDSLTIQPEMIEYNLLQYYNRSRPDSRNPTLFDVFDLNDKKWAHYKVNLDKKNNRSKFISPQNLITELEKKDYDYSLVYVPNTDWIGHRYGPNSDEIINTIKNADEFLDSLYSSLKSNYKIVNMIIFADHGMVPIKKYANIWKCLHQLPFTIGKDYVFFLDSTVARFWFHNEEAKKNIMHYLSSLDNGKLLTNIDYKHYKIDFEDNKFGEIMWLADPGTLIFPNFFQWDKPAKGMHGYEPTHIENEGLFLMTSNKNIKLEKRDIVHLTDIYPTVLDIMNLPIPDTCEGKSIVTKNM